MAPNAIEMNGLKLVSNYPSAEFAKASKLTEKPASVKQAKKGGYAYLKIGWVKKSNSGNPVDAKIALQLIETITEDYDNLPRAPPAIRINLDAKVSSITGRTSREGWIAFPVEKELKDADTSASCFRKMLSKRYGTTVTVKADNFSGPLEVLYPVERDVQ